MNRFPSAVKQPNAGRHRDHTDLIVVFLKKRFKLDPSIGTISDVPRTAGLAHPLAT